MTSPQGDPHVGRESEVGLADGLVDDVRRGKAATLLIEGEAGVGKSRLVGSLIDTAGRKGMTVCRGEAHPFEGTRPFGPIAQALDLRPHSHDQRRARIGRLLVAEHDGPSSASAGQAPDLRYRVVEEVLDLVERTCATGPVTLVLEDLHWADTSTLLAFRSMIDRLSHVPVLLIGTLRTSPRPAELDQLLDDGVGAGAALIRLQPLGPDQVQALALAELGLAPGPVLSALLAKAGGNPLWVVELIRSLAAEGVLQRSETQAEVATTEVPDSLRELVLRRLRYLPGPTLELLQITSVIGDAVMIHDLTAVAGRPAMDLLVDLGEAFRSRLLDESGDAVVFRHQLVHEAIYRDIPGPVRRALHRDVAAALHRARAPLSQIASHLVLGAAPGDLAAVRQLRDAAVEASARDPAASVELLRRAQALLPAGHQDQDMLVAELAQALLTAGHVGEAARMAESRLTRPHDAAADEPLRLTLVSALSLQNRAAELIEWAESWLEQSHALSLTDQSLVLAQASYGRTFSGDSVGGEATAKRALQLAERAGDTEMTVWSLATMSVAVKLQGRYRDAVALSQRAVNLALQPAERESRLRHPHFFLGMALCDSDRMEGAKGAYRVALADYDELGSAWLLADTLSLSAEVSFLLGRWDDAITELETGLRTADEHGTPISVPQSRAYQAVINIGRGNLVVAARLLADLEPELDGDQPRYGMQLVAYAAAVLAEARGQPRQALELLLRAWQRDAERENRYYQRYLTPPLVRLALRFGEPALASEVTSWAEAAAGLATEVPSVQVAALRCRGMVERDSDTMLAAVEAARRACRFLDHAASCEDAASLLMSAGHVGEAKALWMEAFEAYERVGAQTWTKRTGAVLRRLGVRLGSHASRRRPTQGWASLTPTERAVSQLVAEGLTNREVGKRLYMSPHTVNTHLRHVFVKLSVSTRAGLAARVPEAS
ncbi:MAG: AAA family ATPase [Geodermatophilaceae bacterium]|nr:AAA family ATPase [Geodermatophilaceae bacterium]